MGSSKIRKLHRFQNRPAARPEKEEPLPRRNYKNKWSHVAKNIIKRIEITGNFRLLADIFPQSYKNTPIYQRIVGT